MFIRSVQLAFASHTWEKQFPGLSPKVISQYKIILVENNSEKEESPFYLQFMFAFLRQGYSKPASQLLHCLHWFPLQVDKDWIAVITLLLPAIREEEGSIQLVFTWRNDPGSLDLGLLGEHGTLHCKVLDPQGKLLEMQEVIKILDYTQANTYYVGHFLQSYEFLPYGTNTYDPMLPSFPLYHSYREWNDVPCYNFLTLGMVHKHPFSEEEEEALKDKWNILFPHCPYVSGKFSNLRTLYFRYEESEHRKGSIISIFKLDYFRKDMLVLLFFNQIISSRAATPKLIIFEAPTCHLNDDQSYQLARYFEEAFPNSQLLVLDPRPDFYQPFSPGQTIFLE